MVMTSAANQQLSIIRTERGLTIAGTRITLYDVMDYVTGQYPPKFIGAMLNLTEEQVNAEIYAVGLSIIEIERQNHNWKVYLSSNLNRRITPHSKMKFSRLPCRTQKAPGSR